MSDNTQLNPGTGGDTLASDDIAGVKFPRGKITIGANGVNDGDVSSANPLPVIDSAVDGHIVAAVVLLSNIFTELQNIADGTPGVGAATIANSAPVNIASDQVVPVSGPLTDAQLRATPVPVSGTVATGGLTDTQLRAAPVPVNGTVAVTNANLDSSLSGILAELQQKTEPANQQHAIIDSGVVTSVTAITNPLPAGTNVIGHIIVDSGSIEVANDSGNPLPVNGTIEVTNDVGNPLPVNGTVEITNDVGNAIPISAASLPLPALASTSTKQSDGSQKTQVVDGAGSVVGSTGNALDVNVKTPIGQQLAAGSVPVVLTAAQITTLTPPAAITGFNLEATQLLAKADLDAIAADTAVINSNTDPLVVPGAGGYVRQDSTATIAKESGGNLAAIAVDTAIINSNTEPFLVAAAGGYVRQDSTGTIAKEDGGNLEKLLALQQTTMIELLTDIRTELRIMNWQAMEGFSGKNDPTDLRDDPLFAN